MSKRKPQARGAAAAADLKAGRTPRQLRVGEELRHILAEVIRRAHFRDPDLLDAVITITEVRVSPDLRNATAFVMPLAGQDSPKTLAALNRAQAYIRTLVAQEINLRFAPSLSFKLDESFDVAQRIDAVLHRPDVLADLAKPADDSSDPAS